MNTEASWDRTRWRDRQSQAHTSHDPSSGVQAPLLSAPTAINPACHSSILSEYAHSEPQAWDAKSRPATADRRPFVASEPQPPSADAYSDRGPSHERRYPTARGIDGPVRPSITSTHQTSPSTRRSLHLDDRRPSLSHLPDAPLTAQTPRTQDLRRTSSALPSALSDHAPYNRILQTPSHGTTSLPSFASFQAHAHCSDEPDVEGPEIAPMSSRLSCDGCSRLTPLIRDVAVAVAELDENLQNYRNRSVTAAFDFPEGSAVQGVQWILDRLRFTNRDIQNAARRAPPGHSFPQKTPLTWTSPRPGSPPNSLKRHAPWDNDEFVAPKRPRSGASPDQPRFPSYTPASSGDHRGSGEYVSRQNFSPPPPDSRPTSGYPQQGSPNQFSRGLGLLPSPSLSAYPSSVAPSLPPPPGQSAGSPAPSYLPSGSIHSASSSSAMSAHIADLQHQVTVKSLALQTLQSEYASLLQKLQRERVKSQTIEKKTTVADQEVNELLGKNEDLSDNVKSLQAQLEESEKKREAERGEAAREKEQWGRMLDMSGRLHAKSAEERQKLTEERDGLLQKVAVYEEENQLRIDIHKRNVLASLKGGPQTKHSGARGSHKVESGASALEDVAVLKHEVDTLKGRIETLRFSLQQLRRYNAGANEQFRDFCERSGDISNAIDRALNDEPWPLPPENSPAVPDGKTIDVDPSAPLKLPSPKWTTETIPSTQQLSPGATNLPGVKELVQPKAPTPEASSIVASAASGGRAVSPGPDELGFHVQPSTSSPEELIKALGPVPAPISGLEKGNSSTSARSSPQGYNIGHSDVMHSRASPASSTERTDAWMMPNIRPFYAFRGQHPESSRQSPVGDSDAWTAPNNSRLHPGKDHGPHSRTHISPHHHLPSPFASQDHSTFQAAKSPRSYHSSPDPIREGHSPSDSPSSGKLRSPESFGSDPEMTSARDEKLRVFRHSLGDVSPPGKSPETFGQRREKMEVGAADMPPPPRPSLQAQQEVHGSSVAK